MMLRPYINTFGAMLLISLIARYMCLQQFAFAIRVWMAAFHLKLGPYTPLEMRFQIKIMKIRFLIESMHAIL